MTEPASGVYVRPHPAPEAFGFAGLGVRVPRHCPGRVRAARARRPRGAGCRPCRCRRSCSSLLRLAARPRRAAGDGLVCPIAMPPWPRRAHRGAFLRGRPCPRRRPGPLAQPGGSGGLGATGAPRGVSPPMYPGLEPRPRTSPRRCWARGGLTLCPPPSCAVRPRAPRLLLAGDRSAWTSASPRFGSSTPLDAGISHSSVGRSCFDAPGDCPPPRHAPWPRGTHRGAPLARHPCPRRRSAILARPGGPGGAGDSLVIIGSCLHAWVCYLAHAAYHVALRFASCRPWCLKPLLILS